MEKCGKLLLFSYLFNIFDLVATLSLFSSFGIEIEANPIGQMLLANPLNACFYKIVVIGLLLLVIYLFRQRIIARLATYVIFISYSLLSIYHLYIMAMI